MVLTAVAMAFQLDIRFQTAIADHLPAALVNPTRSLETLDDRRATSSRSCARRRASTRAAARTTPSSRTTARRRSSPATTAGSTRKPLTLAALQGPRRADRLLDLHLHQLHPHAAAPGRVGQGVPRRGADDRRRPLARVQLREEGGQRRAGDQAERHRVPGRAGQRARDLERVEQPVLAGQVPDRRQGPRPLRALRRGRLRQDRGRDPRAAGRGGRRAGRDGQARPRATTRAAEATPETYLGAERARSASCPASSSPARATYTPYDGDLPEIALHARRALDDRRRVRDRRAGRDAARQRHRQGRLPRAVRAGDRRRDASTASTSRRCR